MRILSKFIYNYQSDASFLYLIVIPEMSKATSPTFSAFSEVRVKMVKMMGRITALLNFKANSRGSISFLSFPRASTEGKAQKLHEFQARGEILNLLLYVKNEKLFVKFIDLRGK